MANIKDVKHSINNGIREILDVGFAMERSNSAIKKENIVNMYASFPFEDTKDNEYKINILPNIKEDIISKFPSGNKDGQSLILSLLSIYNENKNQRNHIISIEIENNEIVGYFVNTLFLEEDLNMSKLFTDKLKKYTSLSESLNTLIIMFLNRTDSYYKQRYSKDNYEEYSIYKKVEMLKDITNTIYGSVHTIDEMYYLFFTDDINIKSSLYNYYKEKENINYINKFLYKIYDSNIENKKLELGCAYVNYKDNGLISLSQKLALQDINKQITTIIGQGGSGKTYLSYVIMKKNLYIKALASLNKTKSNSLYTTYSKYSLSQFLSYTNEFKELIYINDKEHIQNKINSLNQTINLERYNSVKSKLEKYDLNILFDRYNKYDKEHKMFLDLYSLSNDKINYNKILQYLKYLKENYEPYSFIDRLLIKFNIKKDLPIHIPNILTKPLIINGINVPEKIIVDEIPNTINNLTKLELLKQKKIEKDFENITFDVNNNTPITFEDLDIDFSDLVYFLKYQPIIDNPNLKEDYINCLQDLLNENDTNLELVEDLFPIFSGLTTDITKFNIQFRQIIVDESVLVPGYFFPLIVSKGDNIIAMGDINQLSLNQSFYPNINTIVDKIYNGKGFKLSIDNTYNQQSFFGHVSNMTNRDDMFLLTDNFRCNKDIYLLSKHITKGIDSYDSFLGKYIEKHNLNNNKDNLTKHYSNFTPEYLYREEKFKTPFIFVDNKDKDRYEKILGFLSQNRINRSDVMIITPFKTNINIIKSLVGEHILVDIIENVQGVEKKVIIFDWGVNSVNDESFRYLDIKKFNLILLRSKDIFITIGDKNFLFNDQIENIDGNGYTIVNKFIRNNSIEIYELQ